MIRIIRITVTLDGWEWTDVVAAMRASTNRNQRLFPHPYTAQLGHQRASSIERQATEYADDQATTSHIPVTLEDWEWDIVAIALWSDPLEKARQDPRAARSDRRIADAIKTQATAAAEIAA